MIVEVTLLDGSTAKFELDSKCSGQDLLDKVAEQLNLVSYSHIQYSGDPNTGHLINGTIQITDFHYSVIQAMTWIMEF